MELPRMTRFKSAYISKAVQTAVREWLSEARTMCDVAWAFTVIAKARRPLLAARRRLRLERKIRRVARAHFRSHKRAVSDLAVEDLRARKIRKIEGDDIDRAMEWDVFAESMEEPLKDSYLEGEVAARNVGGIEVQFGLTDEASTAYARERSAELIGMRVQSDGSVILNPNAKFAISKSVRKRIRETIARALEEGWSERRLRDALESPAVWNSRAVTIARTEVAFALNAGTSDSYKEAGVKMVDVLDGPGCLKDGHDDGAAGVNGERWTLSKSRRFPLGHPNCVRDFAPIIR